MGLKRLLILGGTHFQLPVIEYARSAGYYVITCDYLPENPGHRLANEYHNISTLDIEGVLSLSKRCRIDGILAYASDPAAFTASYVATAMGLASNPPESVRILSNKDLYRQFARSSGFCCPWAYSFTSVDEMLDAIDTIALPVMVKPVDSSGSRGVSKVTTVGELTAAFEYAMPFSRCKRVIVEQYIERQGPQIGGEAFVLDGKLSFMCLGDQLAGEEGNQFVPTGMLFPSAASKGLSQRIKKQLGHLVKQLGLSYDALNLEIMCQSDDQPILMEVGPRAGGNLLPELVYHYSGFNLAQYSVETALGHSMLCCQDCCEPLSEKKCAYHAIHSLEQGTFKAVHIDETLKGNIIQYRLFKNPGDLVDVYMGSHCTVGIVLLEFETYQEMQQTMATITTLIRVELG